MNHHQALQQSLVEKYLLDELSPAERAEFEEHYFDCPECAADLRVTAAFLDEAKKQLQRQVTQGPSRFAFLWQPAFLGPVAALLLLVVIYQGLHFFPRGAGVVARVDAPEILPTLSLIGAGSRGGAAAPLTAHKGQGLLLLLDIPAAEEYSSYTCTLLAPGGAALWDVPVSPEQAKDTVSIRVPAERWQQGDYTLLVQGIPGTGQEKPTDLAHYRFTVNTMD